MTQDEIRRLLGGYATDGLTPDERRMLFQAALEDQELFNTLANEDALKELLDDPVTRARVRTAMQPRRRQFHPRRWLLGVAIPAVLAVVLIVMMNRAGAPRLVATNEVTNEPQKPAPAPTAPVSPAPIASAPVAALKARKPKRAVRVERPNPEPPQAEPPQAEPSPANAASAGVGGAPQARPRALVSALAALRAPGPPAIPASVRQQFAEGPRSGVPLYQGPLVQYAVLRSGPEGRAIRVQVTTGIAGYLALYEVDTAGNSTRVYPAGEVAARIAPNVPIQIPAEPIEIREAGAKLRLVVLQAPVVQAQRPAVQEFLPRTQGALGGAAVQATPLVVEIPLAP